MNDILIKFHQIIASEGFAWGTLAGFFASILLDMAMKPRTYPED